MFYQITKNKECTIKNKIYKTRKELGTTYCLRCKDFAHNFRPEEVNVTTKY